MRVFVVGCLALSLVLARTPAVAQEAEVLRRELEQLKQQLQTMQEQYQKLIQGISERLQRLEARPPTAAQPPAATPAPAASTTRPSLAELARPREPFALYERRGAGQLLFDMGVTGDFAGSLTSKRVEKARVGSLTGEENRFSPREIELPLWAD